jgi:hypothetical protein
LASIILKVIKMDSLLGVNDLQDTYNVASSFNELHALVNKVVDLRYAKIKENISAKPGASSWGAKALEEKGPQIRSQLAEDLLKKIGAWKNDDVRESIMYSFGRD